MPGSKRPIRVLVAKPGLDGHDRGAKVVAAALRDAGMEVIYTGLHQTPEMIAQAAIQEDVDVVGLSILSGAHLTLFPRVKQLLVAAGRDDVLVTGGGIIPPEDVEALRKHGIGRLFGPGTPTSDLVKYIEEWAAEHVSACPTPHSAFRTPHSTLGRLKTLTAEYRELKARLEQGGGPDKVRRQHEQGKLTARERIEALLDQGATWFEIGLLIASDQYDGQAPGAGVITGMGRIAGRPVVVVANDATVKAGSWWPETIKKILRAQEIAMRQRIPIVYLVDSAGVNLPYQGGVFPGQYGAARIFYYNSIMRHYLRVPQIAAVMGPCIAGGAYLPALSDVIFMVEGTSFMGLGGPNLVKGATGQTVDAESLGGAATHTAVSAVAHYRAKDDRECLARIREYVARLPRTLRPPAPGGKPKRSPKDLYDLLPSDHRMSYDVRAVLDCVLDAGKLDEFQPDLAPEMKAARSR